MVEVQGEGRTWQAIGLAPVAVLPAYQKQGIGKQLIDFWFEHYADAYFNAVFVLGDPHYYQRFAFIKAADCGFYWQHECPAEAFQVRELRQGFLQKAAGVVYYHPAFYG
jgi:putative acetyltransferase